MILSLKLLYLTYVNIMKKLSTTEIHFIITHEIRYTHSKSGWHWGQKVNKKQTKAEGYFDISDCDLLDADQKKRLSEIYHNHVSKNGVLRLTCQEQRNYHQNLVILKKHFSQLLWLIGEKNVFELLHHTRKHHH